MFRSKTFESITGDLAQKVEDLKTLAAQKRDDAKRHEASAQEYANKAKSATADSERADKVAAKIDQLLSD